MRRRVVRRSTMTARPEADGWAGATLWIVVRRWALSATARTSSMGSPIKDAATSIWAAGSSVRHWAASRASSIVGGSWRTRRPPYFVFHAGCMSVTRLRESVINDFVALPAGISNTCGLDNGIALLSGQLWPVSRDRHNGRTPATLARCRARASSGVKGRHHELACQILQSCPACRTPVSGICFGGRGASNGVRTRAGGR